MFHLRFRADDRVLCPLPLFHTYGLNFGMAHAQAAGAALYLTGRFDPREVLGLLAGARITAFLGVPPMYVAFTALPDLDAYDLAALRVCGSGAAPLPVAVLERFEAATGMAIDEGYGLTETAPAATANAAGSVNKPGTVGVPFPDVSIRLADEHDRDVPPGAEGEVLVQGACVFGGYWQRPEASAEALRGGWFHTGDIGVLDAEGYLTIVDRKKDMINNGGLKVWPREVEEVLHRHPAVHEAAVVPLPDPYAGERPMAFVALRAGQRATGEELIAHVAAHLAKFKLPMRVECGIPRGVAQAADRQGAAPGVARRGPRPRPRPRRPAHRAGRLNAADRTDAVYPPRPHADGRFARRNATKRRERRDRWPQQQGCNRRGPVLRGPGGPHRRPPRPYPQEGQP